MLFPRMRKSHRFKRGMESEILSGMIFPELFWSHFRFFGQHHGNVVAHGINAAARSALQARAIRKQLDRRFANGTNQNVEKFLGNRHGFSVTDEIGYNEQTGTVSKGVQRGQPADCRSGGAQAYITNQKVDSA